MGGCTPFSCLVAPSPVRRWRARVLRICKAMGCSIERTSALAWSVQTIRLAFARRFCTHAFPVGHGEAEIGEHLFMGDGLVMFEPFVGLGDGFVFGGAERVAVFVRDHRFEEMNDGVEFIGGEEGEEVLGVLLFGGEISDHGGLHC